VQIPKEMYLMALEECKNHLHGRIMLTKGDKTLVHLEVYKKFNLTWFLEDDSSWQEIL